MEYVYWLFGYDKFKTLEDVLFNLKFTKKTISRDVKKCESRSLFETNRVKDDIKNNDNIAARIHSENAIRQKNQRYSLMKLSSKLDALTCKLELAIQNGKLTDNIVNIAYGLEKIQDNFSYKNIVGTLSKFDSSFESLDMTTDIMESTIDDSTSGQIPEEEVTELLKYIADENQLKLTEKFLDLDMLLHKNDKIIKNNENNSIENSKNNMVERLENLRK